MKSIFRFNSSRGIGLSFPSIALAAVVGFLLSSNSAWAVDSLGYSFETGLDGFEQNGGGTTVTQDTIGATEGTQSMKVAVVAGATFVGSVTSILDTTTLGHTAIVGDPPGLDHVTFDLTITQRFGKRINPLAPDPFSGFVSIGVTVFGQDQAGGAADSQIEDRDNTELKVGSFEPGTYLNQRIELDRMLHPVTFEVKSFNEIFGTQGSGPNDIIPNSFQFYFNKSGNSSDYDHSLTLYIDNIRFGTGPAPLQGDYNGNGTVDAADYVVWRNGDSPDDTQAGYDLWKANFGKPPGSGSGAGAERRAGADQRAIAAGGWSVLVGKQISPDGSVRTCVDDFVFR